MPRIRTIKPEFFNSYDISCLTPLARLFYAYLWTESDREGFLEWKPNNFRMRFFPTDNYSINDLIEELKKQNLITLHKDNEEAICEIRGFKKHQVINNRETESTLLSRVTHAPSRVIAEGKEGKEGRVDYAFAGETIKLNQKDYSLMKKTYPNIDLDYHLKQLDLELKDKKNWFMEMQSKLNYRNTNPNYQKQTNKPSELVL